MSRGSVQDLSRHWPGGHPGPLLQLVPDQQE
jgi:hypothetical protein